MHVSDQPSTDGTTVISTPQPESVAVLAEIFGNPADLPWVGTPDTGARHLERGEGQHLWRRREHLFRCPQGWEVSRKTGLVRCTSGGGYPAKVQARLIQALSPAMMHGTESCSPVQSPSSAPVPWHAGRITVGTLIIGVVQFSSQLGSFADVRLRPIVADSRGDRPWGTVANEPVRTWKAGWVQALAGSNPASSAHLTRQDARQGACAAPVRPGLPSSLVISRTVTRSAIAAPEGKTGT